MVMNTYEDYLKSEAKNVLPMEEALQIYTVMLGCLDRCNAEGIETPWREQLGEARKRIGDFACFVSYIAGINNR